MRVANEDEITSTTSIFVADRHHLPHLDRLQVTIRSPPKRCCDVRIQERSATLCVAVNRFADEIGVVEYRIAG